MKQTSLHTHGHGLSVFCMQLSLLYQSAIPVYDGLEIMVEDISDSSEKELFLSMAEQLRTGKGFHTVIKEAGCFPSYMEEMIFLGEQTGTLDITLKGLADHYEKEARLAEELRRTLTYPAMLISMLVVILFILFTKVMPVFSDVYAQLGAKLSPVAQAALRAGTAVSTLAMIVIILSALSIFAFLLIGKLGFQPVRITALIRRLQANSKLQQMTAIRRLCSTMSIALRCGLRTEEGLAIAETLVGHPVLKSQICKAREEILNGQSFSDAMKSSGLFTGFELQLIHAASRAGQLESVLEKLSDDYDEKISVSLDRIISQIEPAVVTILTISVGLVLLSVMLPLAGMLASIG